MGYYTIYPNVGGTFDNVNEAHDSEKHPVSFRFRTNASLRSLSRRVVIDIEGLANGLGYIGEYRDIGEDSVNGIFVPGNLFVIEGHRIKVAGEDPETGVYFVPADDPAKAVKVARLAENTASKIIGIAPDTGHQYNKIEIRTQFAGSTKALKTPRVMTGSFTLEAG